MKQPIQKFFREFDLFLAPASLRIHKNSTMKSCFLGIISLMVFGGLIYIIVFNILNVVQYQQVTFQLSQTMIPSSQAKGDLKMFAITLYFQQLSVFQKYFDFYLNYFVEGQLVQRFRLSPCVPDQWSDLGGDYNKTFYFYQMQDMYCPNITDNYRINQTLSQSTPTYLTITLQLCKYAQRSNCQRQNALQFLGKYPYLKVWIYLLDTAIHPEDQDVLSYKVKINKIFVSTTFRSYAQILLSTYRVETDTSLLPWQNIQVLAGLMYDSISINSFLRPSSTIQKQSTIAQFAFGMNRKIKLYKRTVGKFDQIMSYVGGLFALIIPGLGWFLFNYNKYRYEIKVAEGAFNIDEEGNKIKEEDFHFGSYIKYTVYRWLNLFFCNKIKWKRCVQIDQVRENVIGQMDARTTFRRLQKTQQTIRSRIDKNQQSSIVLMEPLSLNKIKNQRLKLDYYDQVIKGEAAVTLQDLLSQKLKKSNSKKINEQNNDFQQIGSANNLNMFFDMQSKPAVDFNLIVPLYHGYDLVQETTDFIKTKYQAQKIVLSSQFEEVEDYLAKVYSEFDDIDKNLIENRVPMIILHRLNKKKKQTQEKLKIASLMQIKEQNKEEENQNTVQKQQQQKVK